MGGPFRLLIWLAALVISLIVWVTKAIPLAFSVLPVERWRGLVWVAWRPRLMTRIWPTLAIDNSHYLMTRPTSYDDCTGQRHHYGPAGLFGTTRFSRVAGDTGVLSPGE